MGILEVGILKVDILEGDNLMVDIVKEDIPNYILKVGIHGMGNLNFNIIKVDKDL